LAARLRDRDNSCRYYTVRFDCATEMIAATRKMAENLVVADVAIAAAGTTAIELAFMGVPAFLMVVAENQAPIASKLHALGAARDLDHADHARRRAAAGPTPACGSPPPAACGCATFIRTAKRPPSPSAKKAATRRTTKESASHDVPI